jgi:hypothetical protein
LAPKTAAPRTEKGYVNPAGGALAGWGSALDQFETHPDLTWPRSVWTYNRMAREEARISSVLRAIGLPIRRTKWRIRQNGASDEATELVARSLGLPIEGASDDEPLGRSKGRLSWREHLREALKALQYGHAVFELKYDLEGYGPNKRAVLRKLAPRPQSTISYFNVDRDGGLVSIQQWPPGTFAAPGMFMMGTSNMGQAIPVNRLAVYTHDMDPGVWTGNSLLRPAFKNWLLKDELIRIEAAAIRRHGIGVPNFQGNEQDSEDEARMDELLEIASNYSGGESAGLATTAGESFTIVSPGGTPIDPRRAIEYHDHQMALVALAHYLNLEGKGGSYALANVQASTFTDSVQTTAEDFRDVAQAHVVEDIIDWNWGPDEPAPLLVFDEIGNDLAAAALQMLVNAKLLTPDDRLEQFLRATSGLPSADPDTERDVEQSGGEQDPTPPKAQTRSAAARSRQRREHPKNRQESLF